MSEELNEVLAKNVASAARVLFSAQVEIMRLGLLSEEISESIAGATVTLYRYHPEPAVALLDLMKIREEFTPEFQEAAAEQSEKYKHFNTQA